MDLQMKAKNKSREMGGVETHATPLLTFWYTIFIKV